MRDALRKITALLAKDSVQFQAATDQLTDIAQAWSVIYVGDPERTKKNSDVLDKIAVHLTENPDIGLQVHGRTGDAREAPRSSHATLVSVRERMSSSCVRTSRRREQTAASRLSYSVGSMRSAYCPNPAAIVRVMSRRTFIPMPKDDIDGKRAAETKKLEESVINVKAQFDQFLRENQIVFNAAREAETKRSRLGIKQSWSIDHLNDRIKVKNHDTLKGIAALLKQHSELSCEVHGFTTAPDGVARPMPTSPLTSTNRISTM